MFREMGKFSDQGDGEVPEGQPCWQLLPMRRRENTFYQIRSPILSAHVTLG